MANLEKVSFGLRFEGSEGAGYVQSKKRAFQQDGTNVKFSK